MNSLLQAEEISPSVYSDNASLDKIRQKAVTDSPAAIKAAAKEFESFFMNMMLKSMRQASEVIGEDSMFSSPQEKMFVGMLDEQMSVELSQQGNLGIADLLTRNLTANNSIAFDLNDPRMNNGLPNLPKPNEKNVINHSNPIELMSDKKVTEQNEIKTTGINENANLIAAPTELKQTENKTLLSENEIGAQINFVEKVNKSPEKKTMFESVANFVDQMMPLANKAASKIGLDPKILLAQAALETGWGKHIIHDSNGKPSYNLFGIKDSKSWQGESVKIDTLEVESGEFVKRKENFRSYSSFEKSFEDFIQFISESPRYQGAMKLVHDAKAFITSIQDAGYATDPQYANKIINIFNRNLVD